MFGGYVSSDGNDHDFTIMVIKHSDLKGNGSSLLGLVLKAVAKTRIRCLKNSRLYRIRF
jgi:hypothetical protein